jgi:hypothetical protein
VSEPKKNVPPRVVGVGKTAPGCAEIPDVGDDAQRKLVAAISIFGDSTVPIFITKLKTFEEPELGEKVPLDGQKHIIRCVNETSSTELLFIDCNDRSNGRIESFSCGPSLSPDAPRQPLIGKPVVVLESTATPGAEFDPSFVDSAEYRGKK